MNEIRVSFSFLDESINEEAFHEEFEQFKELLLERYGITLYDIKIR